MRIPLERALLALLLAAPAAAQTAPAVRSVVYAHPAVKTTVTAHYEAGNDRPQALTYEGPKGRYLLAWTDLTSVMIDDGENQTLYHVYSFEPEGLCYREMHREPCALSAYRSDAIAASLGALIDELAAKKGKLEVEKQLTATIDGLRRRVRADETRRKSLAAMEALAPGSVKDAAWLGRLEGELSAVSGAVDKAAAGRSAGAQAEWLTARALAEADSRLGVGVENVLDWMPRQ